MVQAGVAAALQDFGVAVCLSRSVHSEFVVANSCKSMYCNLYIFCSCGPQL